MSKRYPYKIRKIPLLIGDGETALLIEYKGRIQMSHLPPGTIGNDLVYDRKEDPTLDFKPGENPLLTKTSSLDEIIQIAEKLIHERPQNNGKGYRNRSNSKKSPIRPYYPPKKGLGTI